MIKENLKTTVSTTTQKPMNKAKSIVLTAALAIGFLFPMNAFSMPIAMNWLPSNARPQTTTNQAAATNCSQSSAVSGTYSEKAPINVPVTLGSTWSAAAFQMVAMLLGNLNANARAEMYCEDIKG